MTLLVFPVARRTSIAGAVALAWLAMALPLAAQNPGTGAAPGAASITAARDLYDAAAYIDALSMLDGLQAKGASGGPAIEIAKYRAFCLVALGRTAEAQDAIASILMAQPSFRLAENDVSRRIFAVFEETRQRVLPQAVQRLYERAKAAYDRKEFQQARDGFSLVVTLAEEAGTANSLVKDIGTLAGGFLSLIAANAPPVGSRPVAVRPMPLPATKYVYDATDAEVVAPVAIEQRVPSWPSSVRPQPGAIGVVEVTINERGEVESATMAPPFNSLYDEVLLAAAKSWRYRPATCAGQPVKYRRRVQIVAGSRESPSREGDAPHPAAR